MAERFDRFPDGELREAWGLLTSDERPPPDTPAVYRLGFTSVAVPGFPSPLQLGRVRIKVGRGPVRTQRVDIQQQVPPPLVFDKAGAWIEVGAGHYITLCEIETDLGDFEENFSAAWRDEALGAAGAVAAVLDERLFGREILEDVLILSGPDDPSGVGDIVRNVRHFVPQWAGEEHGDLVEAVGNCDNAKVAVAARWYLKGAREGPSADAIIDLWVATEALFEDFEKPVDAIKERLKEAGLNYQAGPGQLGINGLYKLRNAIVHGGAEHPDRLREGYYYTEAMVRTLIRLAAGLKPPMGWPIHPDMLADPAEVPPELASLANDLVLAQADPKENWHPDGLPDPQEPAF